MSKRKPAGVSFENWIDRTLAAAEARGDFANLPGYGKPLADLPSNYDPEWWTRNLLKREGVSYLPPALQIKRDVERWLEERLPLIADNEALDQELSKLNEQIKDVNRKNFDGPPSTTMPLKRERVIERWKTAREEYYEERAALAAARSSQEQTLDVSESRRSLWRRMMKRLGF